MKLPIEKSNFPEGDNDYFKNIERFSTTTNNSQFKAVSKMPSVIYAMNCCKKFLL